MKYVVLIIIGLFLISCTYNNAGQSYQKIVAAGGSPLVMKGSGFECHNDLDCGPSNTETRNACSNNQPCVETNVNTCYNPSTRQSYCLEEWIIQSCQSECLLSCVEGSCTDFNPTNTIPQNYVWESVDIGEEIYNDRSYTLVSAPANLIDATWLKTNNADKNNNPHDVSFITNTNIEVYIGVDERNSGVIPLWLSTQFSDTGLQIETTDFGGNRKYDIWQGSFLPGNVQLGENCNPSCTGGSMYLIMVVPDANSNECIDIDGDGYGINCELGDDCDDNDGQAWQNINLFPDFDNDNYHSLATTPVCLGNSIPPGYRVVPGNDCNDFNENINPGENEICGNGMDDNCNGEIDEECFVSGLIELTVRDDGDAQRILDPVTSGIPFPKGALQSNVPIENQLRLLGPDQTIEIPAQFKTLSTFYTGEPRWVLIDFQADVPKNGETKYYIDYGAQTANHNSPISIVFNNADVLVINTGEAIFNLNKNNFNFFDTVVADGKSTILQSQSTDDGLIVSDGVSEFKSRDIIPTSFEIEEQGNLRTVVKVKGTTGILDYTARLHFFAGKSYVKIFLTQENNKECMELVNQPNCQDMGSPNSIIFDDLSLQTTLNLGSSRNYKIKGESTILSGNSNNAYIYQDSDGGEFWNNGVINNVLPFDASLFKGYRIFESGNCVDCVISDPESNSGNRADAWIDLSDDEKGVAVGVRWFWQNYPKAIEVENNKLIVKLMPEYYASNYEHRAGEHKTHEINYYFHGSATEGEIDNQMKAMNEPLRAFATPEHYLSSKAFDNFAPYTNDPDYSIYEEHASITIDGMLTWREWKNDNWQFGGSYGWMFFGNNFADHQRGHFNYEFDVIYGEILQSIRTVRNSFDTNDHFNWWHLAESATYNWVDLTIYHFETGGLKWYVKGMTQHCENSDNCLNNPLRPKGQTPNVAHYFTRGPTYMYYLTGNKIFYDGIMEIGDNIKLRDEITWDAFEFDGEMRRPGHMLQVLTDLYLLTWDPFYKNMIDTQLIPESHPDTKGWIDGSSGSVKPWMLAIFVRSMGRYLDEANLNQFDGSGSASYDNVVDSLTKYNDFLIDYAYQPDGSSCINDENWHVDANPRWTCKDKGAIPYQMNFDTGEINDCTPNMWHLRVADALTYGSRYNAARGNEYLNLAEKLFESGASCHWCGSCPRRQYTQLKAQSVLTSSGQEYMYYEANS